MRTKSSGSNSTMVDRSSQPLMRTKEARPRMLAMANYVKMATYSEINLGGKMFTRNLFGYVMSDGENQHSMGYEEWVNELMQHADLAHADDIQSGKTWDDILHSIKCGVCNPTN